jgi:hypothetical protein
MSSKLLWQVLWQGRGAKSIYACALASWIAWRVAFASAVAALKSACAGATSQLLFELGLLTAQVRTGVGVVPGKK